MLVQVTADMLIDVLEPMAVANGLELVTIELVGSRKAPTIRIYLDAPGGITFDQIVDAHTWIDAYMDEKDPFPGAYTLEVSSPGIDRPLRTLEHFSRFSGEEVALTTSPIGGRGRWHGKLEGTDGDDVLIALEDETVRIPFTAIRKAHVKGQIDFSGRKEQ